MTFIVRVFGYPGVSQLAQLAPHNFAANGPWVLEQPYNWSQILSTNGATSVSTTVVPNDTSQVLAIEVPDGNIIRYEINTPGRPGGSVNAGNASPRTSGFMVFRWGVGYTLSFVEQASFP